MKENRITKIVSQTVAAAIMAAFIAGSNIYAGIALAAEGSINASSYMISSKMTNTKVSMIEDEPDEIETLEAEEETEEETEPETENETEYTVESEETETQTAIPEETAPLSVQAEPQIVKVFENLTREHEKQGSILQCSGNKWNKC